MSPRMMALAFRIWQFAEPKGWDCTAGEIADALGEHHITIGKVCAAKGWTGRLRVATAGTDLRAARSIGLVGIEALGNLSGNRALSEAWQGTVG